MAWKPEEDDSEAKLTPNNRNLSLALDCGTNFEPTQHYRQKTRDIEWQDARKGAIPKHKEPQHHSSTPRGNGKKKSIYQSRGHQHSPTNSYSEQSTPPRNRNRRDDISDSEYSDEGQVHVRPT